MVAPKGIEADLLKAIEAARTEGFSVVQLLGNDDLSSVPYATSPNGECKWRVDNQTNLIADVLCRSHTFGFQF